MLHIYVWNAREGFWGHCSMYIERGDAAQSRYVSWWPLDQSNIEPFEDNTAAARLPSYDLRMETEPPHYEFLINAGEEYIHEMPMVRAWDEWKRTQSFRTFTRNCCTTVATLLKGVGGADRYIDFEPVTWWGPNDMVDYMNLLNRQFPVLRPLAQTVPPEITQMARSGSGSRMA